MSKSIRPVTATIVHLIVKFEIKFCDWVDRTTEKKFKYSIVQNLMFEIAEVRKNAIYAMDLDQLFIKDKLYYLSLSHAGMRNVEILMMEFSNMIGMSDRTKSEFDIMLTDIFCNYSRLLNSFNNKVNKESESPNYGEEREHHNYKDA